MEYFWNDFELKKPPFLTLPTTHTKFVVQLHGIIENYFRLQTIHEDEFNETAALLGRLIARRKNSFMKMKGYKAVCKLNAALCRLLRVDFKRDLDSFRCTLPDVEYDDCTLIHLPTRDNLEYLLVRLMALCELFKRIVECCIESAEFFTIQLRVHYFFEINTLLVAVVAKINSRSTKLGNSAIYLYNALREYCNKLPLNQKSKFLVNAPELPTKLEMLIKPLSEEHNSNVSKKDDKMNQGHSKANFLEREQPPLPTVIKAKSLKKKDIGIKVERSENKKTFNIDQLKTVEDIKGFISKESKIRATNITSCITKLVLSHEWNGATKLFERKVQSGEKKKAINIFKKFIGSKL